MPARKSYSLTLVSGRYVAVPASQLTPGDKPLRREAALNLIDLALRRPKNLIELENLARAVHPLGIRGQGGIQARSIRIAFETGRWVLLVARGAAEPRTEARESVAEQLLTAKEVKTWVEFEVVDEDGRPMAEMAFLCMLPDGTIREGFLDKRGRARFDGIDPGNCAFSLTGLSPELWRRQA